MILFAPGPHETASALGAVIDMDLSRQATGKRTALQHAITRNLGRLVSVSIARRSRVYSSIIVGTPNAHPCASASASPGADSLSLCLNLLKPFS